MRPRIALTALGIVAALLTAAGPAVAGSYTVVSCNAAPNHSGQAWQAQAGSVNTYQLCPSHGGGSPNTRGISTRAVGRTFSAGEYSRWWFFAPPGTTISRLDWAGRGSRNTPSWVVEISAQGGVSHSRLIGYAAQPGATGYATAFEVHSPAVLWAPAGTTSLTQNVQCGAGSCGSGATMHTYHAAVTLHDHWAPGVSMSGVGGGEWVRGDRTIAFAASDNTGIKRVELLVDGTATDGRQFGCDYTRPVPCSNQSGAFALRTADRADGARRIDVRVVDGSDTVASTGRTIRVDNTPPAQVTPTVVGGEGWRRGDGFDVRWPSVADNGSPIAGGRWQLCRAGTDACQTGSFDASNPTGLNDVGVGADGSYELRVALRDQVGNQADLRDARPVRLRLDRAAPTVALDPHDPAHPMQASARVADALSGVAGGQIEIQRRGGGAWHEIPTAVEGGRLVGVIDDERYTDGTYDLRARTVDHAGNEASTQQEVGGARAARQLPLRIKTRLTAGHRKVVRTRRTVLRGKGDKLRRRVIVRKRVQFRPRVTVGYRKAATLQGQLTNPDGQPLSDVAVEVSARPQLPGSDFAAAGLIRTDGEGRFSYRVAGTHSRTLRFRYPGTSRIRPTSTDVTVAVRASSSFTLTPRRILNGETVTFTGRIRGGPIPPTGKLVELRKWSGRRWEPFRVVRSQPDGRWRHTEPVRSVRGLVTFRLRARLPAEAGYPYAPANTPARKLRVRGANP